MRRGDVRQGDSIDCGIHAGGLVRDDGSRTMAQGDAMLIGVDRDSYYAFEVNRSQPGS